MRRRRTIWMFFLVLDLLAMPLDARHFKIVSSLSDYASIARYIGADKVTVTSVAKGYQDAHFVKAKPSFALEMAKADLFLTTGLDLELWVPMLIDKSRNPRIREGEKGYVAVSRGMSLLDVPRNPNRAQGDIHIYGNPHIHTDPLKGIQIAENILIGLKKIDPGNTGYYEANFRSFKSGVHRRLYGADLVELIGGDQLARLTQSKQLENFLKQNQFGGKALSDYLGGWFEEAKCLKGKQIIAYHKNWIYFADLFGIEIIDYVEVKPGIPPSARHVAHLIREIMALQIRALLMANYFDEKMAQVIEEKIGARAIIAPLSVNGTREANTYFDLFDIWIREIKAVYSDCESTEPKCSLP